MLSIVILTKNEEKEIVDALESASFADELIIVDDYSQDHTVEASKSLNLPNLKIYKKRLKNFSEQRNYALSKASGDWIFFLDADERITSALQSEIIKITKSKENKNGYFIKREDIMWGKKLRYGETSSVSPLRLGKKNKGVWKGKVHEQWDIKGERGILHFRLLHYPHRTIREFITDINFYTDIRAQELFEKNQHVSLFHIISFPTGKFIHNYFLRQGIRDGLQGFILATFMSFHSFLVRSKLWLKWQKK